MSKKSEASKSDMTSLTGPSAAECATSTGNSLMQRIKAFFANRPLLVIIGLLVTVVIGFLVAWLIYKYIRNKAIDQKSYVLEESKSPLLGLNLNDCNGAKIPLTANGKRFTFTFWIYIQNLDKNAGILRHVLHRGDEKNPFGGSPAVFLGKDSNKLHIVFDTTSRNSNDPDWVVSGNSDTKFWYNVAKRGITIDYVPLQRWVHIGVIVNEDANGGSITSYVDGELVKTKTSNQKINVGEHQVNPQISNLALDRRGDVFVGGTNDSASGIGFSGLVGMIEFFNYNLNAKDMYNVYKKGPIYLNAAGKMANDLGIGVVNDYGVRNPIYKKSQIPAIA